MALEPETVALAKALGIEIADEDDPIYTEPVTVILRPAARRPTKDHALAKSCERILAEAREAMRAYCGLPPEDD
jgi:hypothetical protein